MPDFPGNSWEQLSNRDVVRYVLLSHFFQIGQVVLWFFFLPQLDFKIPGRVGAEPFLLHFELQVTYEYFGEMKTYDLIEGGGDVVVTNENRERYCSDMDLLYFIENIFTFLSILAGVREENYKVSCYPN